MTENYLSQFIQESNTGQTRQMKYGPGLLIGARYYPFHRAEIIYCKAELKYRKYKEEYQELFSCHHVVLILIDFSNLHSVGLHHRHQLRQLASFFNWTVAVTAADWFVHQSNLLSDELQHC